MTSVQHVIPARAGEPGTGRRFRAYTAKHLDMLTQRAGLPASTRLAVRAVATVLPFRTNTYVTEELIDWDLAPDDPMYRLVFPQPDMLPEPDVARLDLWNPPASHHEGPIFLNVRRVLDMPQAVALAFPRPIKLYVKDDAEARAWDWPLQLQQSLGQEYLQIRKVGE